MYVLKTDKIRDHEVPISPFTPARMPNAECRSRMPTNIFFVRCLLACCFRLSLASLRLRLSLAIHHSLATLLISISHFFHFSPSVIARLFSSLFFLCIINYCTTKSFFGGGLLARLLRLQLLVCTVRYLLHGLRLSITAVKITARHGEGGIRKRQKPNQHIFPKTPPPHA